ncbi:MAG: O-antigen ligase family protein [Thermoanaerobaculia bacterium]
MRSGWTARLDFVALIALFAWILWIPLPFGSNVPGAWVPLLAVPFAVCAVAAICRLVVHASGFGPVTRAWTCWTAGAGALILFGVAQLLPLPPGLLRFASWQSHDLWVTAARVGHTFGVDMPRWFPITVDPTATSAEVLRIAGLAAAFIAASLLVRGEARRVSLAAVLCVSAVFQVGYGVREVALQRYEIWGWRNVLVNYRVTGTFVNPNHFAHYLSIALPMALFLIAVAWRRSGTGSASLKRRMMTLVERHSLWVGLSVLAALAIVAAVLLSRSRGSAVALAVALAATMALLSRRVGARIAYAGVAGAMLVLVLVLYLGGGRTVDRFRPTPGDQSFGGRRAGVIAAFGVWQRFPLFGSGLGTFQSVVTMAQEENEILYHRAHNDYAELVATAGAVGALPPLTLLIVGIRAMVLMTVGRQASQISWKRRAFQIAALTSLLTAMVHALFDFNFFIPANPATLAVILGAAAAPLTYDTRSRR